MIGLERSYENIFVFRPLFKSSIKFYRPPHHSTYKYCSRPRMALNSREHGHHYWWLGKVPIKNDSNNNTKRICEIWKAIHLLSWSNLDVLLAYGNRYRVKLHTEPWGSNTHDQVIFFNSIVAWLLPQNSLDDCNLLFLRKTLYQEIELNGKCGFFVKLELFQ